MCFSPIQLFYTDSFGNDLTASAPCGKCLDCLKDKQNSIKIRILEESRNHLYTYFFTLTYRDETAPKVEYGKTYYTFSKRHIQDWIKRSRIGFSRLLKREISMKYFVCSEYGPNTGRGHYHGVLMTSVSPSFIVKMFIDWRTKYGFFNYSRVDPRDFTHPEVSSGAFSYVAKYCCKIPVLFTPVEREINDLCVSGVLPKPFFLSSKGLGSSYVDNMYKYHRALDKSRSSRVSVACDRAFYHFGTFKYKLPKYYKERLFFDKVEVGSKKFNTKTNEYEFKKVKRYKKVSSFSHQVSSEIRSRILADDQRKFDEFVQSYPDLSDSEISSLFARSQECAKKDRQNASFRKMSKFYNRNRFKSKKL